MELNASQLENPVAFQICQTVHIIDASSIAYGKIKMEFGYKTGIEVTAVSINGTSLTKNGSGSPSAGQFYPTTGNYPAVSINPHTGTDEIVTAAITVKISGQSYTFTVLLNTTTGATSPVACD